MNDPVQQCCNSTELFLKIERGWPTMGSTIRSGACYMCRAGVCMLYSFVVLSHMQCLQAAWLHACDTEGTHATTDQM